MSNEVLENDTNRIADELDTQINELAEQVRNLHIVVGSMALKLLAHIKEADNTAEKA